MPIPSLRYDGILPPGLYLADLNEIKDRFGINSPRRKNLFAQLRLFVDLARHCGALRMLVNGSFVTAKAEPNDVDVVIWLGANYLDLLANDDGEAILLEQMVDSGEPREIFIVDSEQKWNGWIEFFSQVRGYNNKQKGLVEVKLT